MKILWISVLVFTALAWHASKAFAGSESTGASCTLSTDHDMPLPPQGAVPPKAALELIQKLGTALIIIDVRTEKEFAQGHIPDAILLPLQDLQNNIPHEIQGERPILLICRTGRRAGLAYDILHETYPSNSCIWFLDGSPQYYENGTYTFR